MKPSDAWPNLQVPKGGDDPFGNLRADYFKRLRSDLAQLTALRAKFAGAGTGSNTVSETIRRLAHGMAGAAAIFKAGDVMRAAVTLEQAVRAATPDADDEVVRRALDAMIHSLRSICGSTG
jgi:hypothetical protein